MLETYLFFIFISFLLIIDYCSMRIESYVNSSYFAYKVNKKHWI